MNTTELSKWIKLAEEGDNEAIAVIVKEYHGRVHQMCKIYTPEGGDVRKVETKAFSKALKNLKSLPSVDMFEEWLYGYVRDEAMKVVVQKPVEEVVQNLIPEDATMAIETPVPPVRKANDVNIPAFKPEVKPVEEPVEEEQEPVKMPELPKRPVRKEIVEEEEEEEYRPAPKRSKMKYVPIEEDEDDDYDDDYDDYDDEPRGLPSWLLVILIVLAIIVATSLALFSFAPRIWNGVVTPLNAVLPLDLPLAEIEGGVESEITVTTPTPVVTAEAPVETPEAAEATPEATIETTPEPTPVVPTTIGTVTIHVDNLNIRSQASTSGSKVGQTTNGATYDVYETTTAGGYTWYRIGEGQWIADGGNWVTFNN